MKFKFIKIGNILMEFEYKFKTFWNRFIRNETDIHNSRYHGMEVFLKKRGEHYWTSGIALVSHISETLYDDD